MEKHLRQTNSVGRIGSYDCDFRTEAICWSDELYDLLGLDASSFIPTKESLIGMLHPADRTAFINVLADTLTSSSHFTTECRAMHSRGEWRYFEAVGSVIRDGSHEIVGIRGTIQDITHRKNAENALRDSETRNRALLEGSPVCTKIIDLDSRLLYMSSAGQKRLKITDIETIYGCQYPPDFFPEESRQALREHLERAISGEICDTECHMLATDGDEVWYHTTFVPARNENGHIQYIIASSVDITDRKRSEVALSESRRMLGDVLNTIPARVFWKDRNSVYMGGNRLFAQDAGFSDPNEVIGKSDQDMVWADQARQYRSDDQEVMKTGRPMLNYEEPQTTPQGETSWLRTNKIPLRDANNQIYGILGTYEDITEQKKGEVHKKELEAQLRQSQKMDAIGQLAGGIAHDFNNLLTVILGNTELLLSSMSDSSQTVAREAMQEGLVQIKSAGQHAASLTRQLLAFSRNDAPEPKVLDVNKAVHEMGGLLKRLIREHICLEVTPSERPCFISADQRQFEQVIVNLAVNAADAMPTGGQLSISVDPPIGTDADERQQDCRATGERFVTLTVTDSGTGMAPDVLEHMFEPFFTTKPVGKGTGLGLATVYGIVQQMDGHISAASRMGQGSTFTLRIPKVDVAKQVADPIESVVPPSNGETILVCEDQILVRNVMCSPLRASGYSVIEAENGEQAIDLARSHQGRIDLLISDIVMPGMNGKVVADHLRSEHPDMRVLFVSGYTADHLSQLGIEDQAIELLHKPFGLKDLFNRVQKVLGRAMTENKSLNV